MMQFHGTLWDLDPYTVKMHGERMVILKLMNCSAIDILIQKISQMK